MQMVQCGNKMRHSLSTKLVDPSKKIKKENIYFIRKKSFYFNLISLVSGGGEKDESSTNSNLRSSSFKSYPHAILNLLMFI